MFKLSLKLQQAILMPAARRLPPSRLPTMAGTYLGVAYYMPALAGGAEGFTVKVGHGDDVVKRCNKQRVNILYAVEERENWVLNKARHLGSHLQSDWAFAGYTETFGLFETRREAEDFAEAVAMDCTVRYDYRALLETQAVAA